MSHLASILNLIDYDALDNQFKSSLAPSAHLLSAAIFPLTCLCSTLPVSHTSSSGQLSTPRVFPGLITCCRSPTCLPRLCPGYYLSLLSSTTSFAYSLLVALLLSSVAKELTTGPVCQLGNPSAVDFTFSQRHQARSCSL
ncbi:unnamed protein product [Pleuronectes platessa]|uniref:Uncharacterized protein n=1 Tax=Pleuronectes platessa TaxID=8262 RepID=A0A9N7VBX5_PLEPL|nr:unnamed protein product [Pleuronectes platessa]